MEKVRAIVILLALSLIMLVGSVYIDSRQPRLMPEGVYDFPDIYIYSELDPFDIDRELWHSGSLSVRSTAPAYLSEDIKISIRGRGNSSWIRGEQKRPLRIRFEKPRSLLDSKYTAEDWVLISNLFDPSVIRNHAAFYFADLLYGIWTPFSRLVHLYVNDEYRGVYQLANERYTAPGRAKLFTHPNPLRSSFLLEIDALYDTIEASQDETENLDCFFIGERVFNIKFPKRKNWNGHLEYARRFMTEANDAILSRDYKAIDAIIDITSFLDYYIVMEVFKNIDVGQHSMFVQIRGHGNRRKLHFGPVWDFDRSSGNTLFWSDTAYIFAANRCPWLGALSEVPEISVLIRKRWVEVKNNELIKLIDYIDYLSENYQAAFERNFQEYTRIVKDEPRWLSMLPDEIKAIETYGGQLNYFADWLEKRITWLDGYFYSTSE